MDSNLFEKVLQDGESVVMQEDGIYCGDGKVAALNPGHIVLTDRRIFVCKSTKSMIGFYIGIGLMAGGIPFTRGVIEGAVWGMIAMGIGLLIEKLITRGKVKLPEKTEYSCDLNNIESAEDGTRGVRKVITIQSKSGEIFKIDVKDKVKWKSALAEEPRRAEVSVALPPSSPLDREGDY